MKVQSLLCVLTCLCLALTHGTLAAPPDKKPLQDKESEVKELVAERQALRQRLEEIEKRLIELKSVPVLVHIGGGRGNKMRRDELFSLLVSLHTDQMDSRPVSARDIFKNQPFRFEVEIPHEDAKQSPLRVPGLATEWYEGSHEMNAKIRVPKEAKLGPVEIKLSWPAFQRITKGNTTMKVYVLPVK